MDTSASELLDHWIIPLFDLCERMRNAARAVLLAARKNGDFSRVARAVGEGAGDTTYGLDEATESALREWAQEVARMQPLSLLSEGAGWRHLGPGPGGVRELAGFDHGGPRIVVDPVDGTRNLMTDLRSAWSVVGMAGPGADVPRQKELVFGMLSEIPDTRAASYRRLSAVRGGPCHFEERTFYKGGPIVKPLELRTGSDDRVDHGYFPFFKYMADMRPQIAAIEARFLERIEREERADLRSCWDDQYISNGGQLALLALGTYRMLADLRAFLAERRGRPTLTTKPYDIAGALLCAQAAGCIVTAVDGGELDFPIDVKTPVSWVAWVNEETRARLAPHLAAVLAAD
jgi:fructose-1,6-bisphosphatase/inositol monophosphatase family enzyme